MIDAVLIWISTNTPELALSNLTDIYETVSRETGEVIHKGMLKNLRVKVTGGGVSINGSLPKFHIGNNYLTLTRDGVEEAIEELSDLLSLPIGQAKVFRLEVGTNLVMDNPLIQYFRMLGSSGRYHRIELKHGVLYKNSLRGLLFYDKKADMKRHKEQIPESLSGKYLLRYERKLNRRLAKQCHRQEVPTSLLYEEGFFSELIDGWEADYFAIDKAKRLVLESADILKSSKQFDRTLAANDIRALGQDKVLAWLDDHKTALSKVQRSRMRQHIRTLFRAKTLSETADDILELDAKIRQAAQFYREM